MIEEIAQTLKRQDQILILFHASPDGDAIGSACALLRGLRRMGKQAALQCADPVPPKFDYLFEALPDAAFDGSFTPGFIVTVDVADIRLLGGLKETYQGRIDMAIDHHAFHIDFAKRDYVDVGCAANAEIIYTLLLNLDMDIDRYMADAIYTGIATDTGCFRYRNVTWNTHNIAAEVISRGAAAGDINQKMFETYTRAQMEAERMVMSTMSFHFDDRCAMIVVTKDLMEKTGLQDEDVNAFVSRPREIEGVLIGLALKQRAEGDFKISFRTNPPANASAIAEKMGGGGHNGAAGCSFRGTLEEAKERVLAVCETYLREMDL